jgi:hypothetical protein
MRLAGGIESVLIAIHKYIHGILSGREVFECKASVCSGIPANFCRTS